MIQRVRQTANSVGWQYISAIGTIVVAFGTVAIWLGSVSKQVEINTRRVDNLETFSNDVRQHDANTVAEQRAQDRRIDAIEKKLK